MSSYIYSPLKSQRDGYSIRLVRLLPNENDDSEIECQLFDYFLSNKNLGHHLYEALSYVWGDPTGCRSILLNNCAFEVTHNLYSALSRIRNQHLERIVWIDAICINQQDLKEREEQIQYMAKIYGVAKCVIVWLGETADGSDQALDAIGNAAQSGLEKPVLTRDLCNNVLRTVSFAAKKHPPKLRNAQYLRNDLLEALELQAKKSSVQQSLSIELRNMVLKLIERPWFRRVWVLQEAAAARQIIVMCGEAQIDGYTFSLGLQRLDISDKTFTKSQALVRSAVFLISQAGYRSKSPSWWSGRTALEICSLAELIDMYHEHDATQHHDKVFALLGMSTDDLTSSGLLPDYKISWETLFINLLHYIFGKSVWVQVLGGSNVVIANVKGFVIGEVSSVEQDISWSDRQQFEVTFWSQFVPPDDRFPSSSPRRAAVRDRAVLSSLVSASPLVKGDLICVFEHNSSHTVVRPRQELFEIIKLAANPIGANEMRNVIMEEYPSTERDNEKWTTALKSANSARRDFLLAWKWKATANEQEYEDAMAKSGLQIPLSLKAERLSKVAIILAGSGEVELIGPKIRDAINVCKVEVGKHHEYTLTCMDALGLLWANNGMWEKAETYLLRSIRKRILVQGGSHSKIHESLHCLKDLASAHEQAGNQMDTRRITMIADVLTKRGSKVDEPFIIGVAETLDKKAMEFLLEERGHEFKVTKDILQAAMRNLRASGEVARLLLEKRKDDLKITDEVFRTAVKICESESVIRFLLEQRGGEFKITEEIVEAAAENENPEILNLILEHIGDKVEITSSILNAAAHKSSAPVVDRLLRDANNKARITSETIELAASNRCRYGTGAEGVLEVLLQHLSGEIQATDRTFEVAASRFGSAMIEMLLYSGGDEIVIPESAFDAAVEKGNLETIERLLQQPKENLKITDEKMESITKNERHGLVKLLLQYREDDIKTSESVIERAMTETDGAWVLRRLWRDQEKEIAITEGILQAVSCHAEIMRLLIATRGPGLPVTSHTLTAAAKGEAGDEILRLLLQDNGFDAIVTEDVVEAATHNRYCPVEILELLLDLRGNEVVVNEKAVLNAVGNIRHGEGILKLLLKVRRNEVKVTEEMVKACWVPSIMWQLLDRLEDFSNIPDEVRKAIPQKWDTKEKVMKDMKRQRRRELEKERLPDDSDHSEAPSI